MHDVADRPAIVPTPETLRRIDQGEQFLSWLIPRLAGDGEERETTLVMLFANMDERYAQGIHDAAHIVQRLSEARPQSRELRVAAEALAKLEKRHRSEQTTSLDR